MYAIYIKKILKKTILAVIILLDEKKNLAFYNLEDLLKKTAFNK